MYQGPSDVAGKEAYDQKPQWKERPAQVRPWQNYGREFSLEQEAYGVQNRGCPRNGCPPHPDMLPWHLGDPSYTSNVSPRARGGGDEKKQP